MSKKEILHNLTEVKNILSNTLKSKEVEKLMTENKSFCIKSLIQKELNAEELAEVLKDTLNY